MDASEEIYEGAESAGRMDLDQIGMTGNMATYQLGLHTLKHSIKEKYHFLLSGTSAYNLISTLHQSHFSTLLASINSFSETIITCFQSTDD